MNALRLTDFDEAMEGGWLSRKDRGPLSLYCYTARCVHERHWTDVTRAARGVIFDRPSGECVARPFPKFFNLGEMPETQPEALPADGFRVEEKLDGSLAIVFHHDGEWDVCTKGSFDSEQAVYAREELLPRMGGLSGIPPWLTLLFELIYPENRIVVDYRGRNELVLLGAIDRETGRDFPSIDFDRLLGVRTPAVFPHRNLLDLPFPEDGAAFEGYVAHFSNGLRVKVKSPRYVAIHRLLEYRSPRRILDMIANDSFEAVRAQIPDGIAGDFDDVAATLRMSIRQLEDEATSIHEKHRHLLSTGRKEYALAVRESRSPTLSLVFALADGRPIREAAIKAVWKSLRPDPEATR